NLTEGENSKENSGEGPSVPDSGDESAEGSRVPIPHNSPKTGDESNAGLWLALAVAAACAAIFTLIELSIRKREDRS
ncbi:MAG: hypothetical protein FWC86_02135, partial [Coriobacteriia bacterium]|nr:hypothetical protein [Coriobacteriia bacterium]